MNSYQHRGFALIVSLLLLAVLTMIAVIATRGAGLEVQMASNSVSRIEAFDVSDSSRRVLGEVIDVHTFVRGWPNTLGGSVRPEDFAYTLPAGLILCDEASVGRNCVDVAAASSKPRNWYLGNTETAQGFDPRSLDIDARFSRPPSATIPLQLTSRISIYKMITDLNPGAGSAMVAGYEGVGKSAAAGGGRIFYYAGSVGEGFGDAQSEAETGAAYRHVIRN